jgi:hypothetical protein
VTPEHEAADRIEVATRNRSRDMDACRSRKRFVMDNSIRIRG